MKSWLVSAFLVLTMAGCAADAPQGAPAHAPRTLTPDREIANPATPPNFEAADTTQPAPDSVP